MGLRYLAALELLPTLLVGLDCLLIGHRPHLFWASCGLWAAGLIWTARWWTLRWPHPAEEHLLRPWLEYSLRPLGWTLGMLWFLPLAAHLNARPDELAPILSGPLLSLVTLAAVLTTIARGAGGWQPLLVCFKPPSPSNLWLVDATVVGSAVLTTGLERVQHSSLDDSLQMVLGDTPESWLWCVSLWLWLVLWRLPVGALSELAQGRKVRWPLGAVLGFVAALAWCHYLSGRRFAYNLDILGPSLKAAGVLVGLLLAWPGNRRLLPDREKLLRSRLRLWPALPLLLVSGLVGYFCWATWVPPDPPLVSQILGESQRRQAAQSRPLKRLSLSRQDREILGFQMGPGGRLGSAEESLLRRVRAQLRQGHTGWDWEVSLLLDRSARRCAQAGRIEAALDNYLLALACTSAEGGNLGLVQLVAGHHLSSPSCERILGTLDHCPTSPRSVMDSLDDSFVEVLGRASGEQSASPAAVVRERYARYVRYLFIQVYLRRRAELVRNDGSCLPIAPDRRVANLAGQLEDWEIRCRTGLSQMEAVRALAALELYRNQHGQYPKRLEDVSGLLRRPLYDYLSGDGMFFYARVGSGRRLETRLDRRWADRVCKPIYAP